MQGATFTKGIILSCIFLLSSCSNVDKHLLDITNAISSPDPVTGNREVNLSSEQEEIQKATRTEQRMLALAKQKGIRVDHQIPEYKRVLAVFSRLKRVVHRQKLPWSVHLIDQKQWNAFTIGGGKVFLYTGLFKGPTALRNDDELAVVLAHEMAHVTARHVTEQSGKLLLGNLADKKTRSQVYQASFSTIQESEADKISVMYLALAGYDPRAAVNVWRRMAMVHGSKTGSLLHTHPLNQDRANALVRYARSAMNYYQANQVHPEAAMILRCNQIWCNSTSPNKNESGTSALLETLFNSYIENTQAKEEARRRQARAQR